MVKPTKYISLDNIEINKFILYLKNNNNEIDKFILKNLNERIDLLKKMNYIEWIDYNNKNKVFKILDNNYLCISIFEKVPHTNNFICRVNKDGFLINQSWEEYVERTNNILYFNRFKLEKNLILNMFNNFNLYGINSLNYNWINPNQLITICYKSIYLKFIGKNGIEGIIFINYPIDNLSYKEITKNKEFIFMNKFIIAYIFLFIIGLVFNIFNSNTFLYIKSYIFLIIFNIYFYIFLNSYQHLDSTKFENEKLTMLSRNILSLSYLVAVNIFIINSLKIKKYKVLFIETTVMFGCSIILLLISIFKINNSINIKDIVKERISNIFLFNYSIILNILIVINYLIYKFHILIY